MDGRVYTVQFNGQAIAAACDLFEVLAPTDRTVRIHGWVVGQTSDVGDAAEELLRIETVRGVGSVASGNGTGYTPQPVDDGDAAFGGTVETYATTRMATGTGTLETLEQHLWNVRAPLVMFYPPELRPVIKGGARWTLSLPAAPADSLTVTAMLWIEEV